MSQDREIQKFIKRLYRWVLWRHLAKKLIKCVPVGILGGAVLEIIAYFTPWYSVHFWALGVMVLSLLIALIWGIVTRPGVRDAALALDETGLKERTVTALELLGDNSFFAGLQRKDAWEHLGEVSVRKRLPIGISWKQPVILVLVAAVFCVSFAAPSPAKEKAQQRHLVAQQAKEEEEKIEKVSEELAEELENENLTSEEYEEYKDLLEQLKQELSETETQEALEKTLERAEYKLSQAAEKTENQSIKEKMQQLSASLGRSEKENPDNSQDALQTAEDVEELAKTAEELLEKLDENGDLSNLSEEELKELVEALEQLAQSAEDSDLAEALQNAASGVSAGNLTSSQLASAQATVGAMKQQAQAVLAQGETNSGQSGNGASSNSNGNSSSQSGNGNGNGNNSGNGNGNGNGSGNGSGSGSGSGTGWNYGGKNGTEKETTYNGELVSVPNGVGEDDNLTGSAGDGTSYSSQGGPSLTWSGNSVAYEQVIGSYSDQAMSKIQGSNYPAGMQDIVKNYFEQLNQ